MLRRCKHIETSHSERFFMGSKMNDHPESHLKRGEY